MANRIIDWLETKKPDAASFRLKILISVLIFYVGVKLIRWMVKLLSQSMDKAGIDKGVNTFICSLS